MPCAAGITARDSESNGGTQENLSFCKLKFCEGATTRPTSATIINQSSALIPKFCILRAHSRSPIATMARKRQTTEATVLATDWSSVKSIPSGGGPNTAKTMGSTSIGACVDISHSRSRRLVGQSYSFVVLGYKVRGGMQRRGYNNRQRMTNKPTTNECSALRDRGPSTA